MRSRNLLEAGQVMLLSHKSLPTLQSSGVDPVDTIIQYPLNCTQSAAQPLCHGLGST